MITWISHTCFFFLFNILMYILGEAIFILFGIEVTNEFKWNDRGKSDQIHGEISRIGL